MDLTGEFAKQGLGYLIAAIEAGVIIWLFSRLDAKDKVIQNLYETLNGLQEKRVVESKEYAEGFIGIGKDLINSMQGIKDAQQAFTRFIEKFQTVKNG